MLLLVGCGSGTTEKKEEVKVTIDTDAFLKKVGEADIFDDTLAATRDSFIAEGLELTMDKIEFGKFFMGSGFTGEGYGVFKCKSKEDAEAIVEELKTFVEAQKGIYISYAPEAIPRFDGAIIKQKGSYVAYVAADKNVEANKLVEEFFN